jgi:TFIIF, beta subunit HTH domain/TFIIF, beta subunit N-terminus
VGQVPHFVAKEWRAACDKAMNVDGEDVGPVLGSIRITPPAPGDGLGNQPQFALKLDNETTAELPQEYKMKVVSRAGPAMLAFSSNAGRVASEGVVQHRLEVEPTGGGGGLGGGGAGTSGAGGLSSDPAYRKLSRERSQAASAKTRTIQMMTDHKITNIRKPVGADLVGTKRKAETKRTAMDKEELQAVLFRLFEKQTHWAFAQLQRDTEQPTPHLKLILGEIAVQNKRGPYRDLWELKKEYRN